MIKLSNAFVIPDTILAQATIQTVLLGKEQKTQFVHDIPMNIMMCINILEQVPIMNQDHKSGYVAGFFECLYIFSLCHSLMKINQTEGFDAKLTEFLNELMEPPTQ